MKILLALAAFLLALTAMSQPYHKAIGVKFPVGVGVTYKNFIRPAAALEFQKYDCKFIAGEGEHSGVHGGAVLPESLRWLWRDWKVTK